MSNNIVFFDSINDQIEDGGLEWTPSEISTLAWYDMTDTSTIYFRDGIYVNRIDDKSGNELNLTQDTGANQPIIDTRTIGEYQALEFQGAQDIFRTDGQPDGDVTIFVVVNIDVLVGSQIYSNDGSGGNKTRQYIGSNFVDFGGPNVLSMPTASGNDYIIMGRCDDEGGSTVHGYRINGGEETTAITTRTTPNSVIRLGSYASVNNWYDGLLGEVIVINSLLSDDDRQKVEGYLAHKWSLTGNLPSNHPYKNSKPLP
jgi:hypothetical protein